MLVFMLLHTAVLVTCTWCQRHATPATGRAWHFTDIHVDPIYVVGSDVFAYCNGAVTSNKALQAGTFGNSTGNCATPYALYHSALDFMVHDNEPVDFVLFTGDFTQAGLKSESKADGVMETINRTHAELKAALPAGTKVYGSVGNHDSWPGDQFPHPCADTCQPSYQVMAEAWDLDAPARATVLDGGYYAQRAAPGLMIVAPNTMYWTEVNAHVKKGPADGAYAFGFKQMDWFADTLAAAAKNRDAVWVLGHVPGDEWLPAHARRYQQLIEAHKGIVKGQFYGHDHQDGIKLTRACEPNGTDCTGAPTGVLWAGPSLTEGFPAENPAIRLMEYSPTTFEFTAAKTYSADLEAANAKGSVGWAFEYDTADALGLPNLSPAAWEAWIQQQMSVNQTVFLDYLARRRRHFAGPRSKGAGQACPGLNTTCFAQEACYLLHLSDAAAAKCVADACRAAPVTPSKGPVNYTMTTGIKWCSGGGNYSPGNVLGAGVDGLCPLVPHGWSMDKAALACEGVCTNATSCVGFTLYPVSTDPGTGPPYDTPRECCFRTISVASQPPLPGSHTRCYAKPHGRTVCGIPQ